MRGNRLGMSLLVTRESSICTYCVLKHNLYTNTTAKTIIRLLLVVSTILLYYELLHYDDFAVP